jgi:phosphate acetyltransferase
MQNTHLAPKNKLIIDQALTVKQKFVVGVVSPVRGEVLAGALLAAEKGLITPILIGPRKIIAQEAADLGKDITVYECLEAPDDTTAAKLALALARENKIAAIMKGSISTSNLMRLVVAKEEGVRTERRMSHCMIMDVPAYDKLMIITDAALNIVPDLATKQDILLNAIDFANSIGIKLPRVAVLAAAEDVAIGNSATVDAAILCKMVERGQIKGCKVDGPLSIDLAISKQAAIDKKFTPMLDEKPDIFLMPDLNAANIAVKILDYLAGGQSAGIVLGARVPIIMMRRSSPAVEFVISCALAKLYNYFKNIMK